MLASLSSSDPELAVRVEKLVKRYQNTVAVDGISLEVKKGEIFGVLGPNGAGKTTMIECIEGLRQPDGGTIRVLGLNPHDPNQLPELRDRAGVQLQSASLPARLRVSEVVDLFEAFYAHPEDGRALLATLGLADHKRAFVSQLSGGQRQRLFIALALINHPEIVFLDELTTGLDPQARHTTWKLVRDIRDRGVTVFLTTHFMDEAENLCDRIAILNHGRLIALDSPARLIENAAEGIRVIFETTGRFSPDIFQGVAGVLNVAQNGRRIVVTGRGDRLVSAITRVLDAAGVPYSNLHTEQPNLEQIYLSLTGANLAE